jgi:probable phosphoglycerate mutase
MVLLSVGLLMGHFVSKVTINRDTVRTRNMKTASLKMYLLRHGETIASKTGGYCGTLDPELTRTGHLMAEDFAKSYAELPWAAIFSSPLQRAAATAKPSCDRAGLPMQHHDGLKEMAFGQWEGKHPEEVDRAFHDDYIRWLTDPGWNAPTGGQNGVEVARNSSRVLEKIRNTYDSGNVLIVSHSATIRIMLCSLLGIDIGRFRDRISMPVGSVSIVEIAEHGPLLHLLGDRSHFSEPVRISQLTT